MPALQQCPRLPPRLLPASLRAPAPASTPRQPVLRPPRPAPAPAPTWRSITGSIAMSTAAEKMGSGFTKQWQMTLVLGALEVALSQIPNLEVGAPGGLLPAPNSLAGS